MLLLLLLPLLLLLLLLLMRWPCQESDAGRKSAIRTAADQNLKNVMVVSESAKKG